MDPARLRGHRSAVADLQPQLARAPPRRFDAHLVAPPPVSPAQIRRHAHALRDRLVPVAAHPVAQHALHERDLPRPQRLLPRPHPLGRHGLRHERVHGPIVDVRGLVVPQHRVESPRVEVEELGDPPERRRRLGHEVLVPHLEELAGPQAPPPPVGRAHRALPCVGRPGEPVRSPAVPPADPADRRHHGARIADEVDELRVREHRVDGVEVEDDARPLVAPARLSVVVGVEAEAGAEHRPERGRGSDHGGHQLVRVLRQLPGSRAPALDHPAREPAAVLDVPQVSPFRASAVAVDEDARLARDRELRVRIEHRPQQRGPRARRGADEDRRPRARRRHGGERSAADTGQATRYRAAAHGHRNALEASTGHAARPRADRAAAPGPSRLGRRHRHDRRRRSPPVARVCARVRQLRRPVGAGVGARRVARFPARVHRRLRADPASARHRRQLAGAAVRGARRHGDAVADAAVVRRARLPDLPAGRGAVQPLGRPRGGAGGRLPAGDHARRADRLPGPAVRGARDRGGAARGAAVAPRTAGAGTAGPRRAAAARGVGARRSLLAVPVAGDHAARARAVGRPGRRPRR